jgi:hypothetical protein
MSMTRVLVISSCACERLKAFEISPIIRRPLANWYCTCSQKSSVRE